MADESVRDAWIANIERGCEASFAQHRILWRDATGWEIARPDSNNFAARVVMPGMERIVVVGDGPDIIFYSSYRSPEGAVRWLASSGLDYLATKVRAGVAKVWEQSIAIDDLEDCVADMQEAWSEEHGDEPWEEPEWVQEARDGIEGGDWDGRQLYQHVTDATDDGELAEGWGDVPSHDLITARHAARVLVRLLDAEPKCPCGERSLGLGRCYSHRFHDDARLALELAEAAGGEVALG